MVSFVHQPTAVIVSRADDADHFGFSILGLIDI
jgi:hypothetical protein